jgi:hypothetical protein
MERMGQVVPVTPGYRVPTDDELRNVNVTPRRPNRAAERRYGLRGSDLNVMAMFLTVYEGSDSFAPL